MPRLLKAGGIHKYGILRHFYKPNVQQCVHIHMYIYIYTWAGPNRKTQIAITHKPHKASVYSYIYILILILTHVQIALNNVDMFCILFCVPRPRYEARISVSGRSEARVQKACAKTLAVAGHWEKVVSVLQMYLV